MLVQPTTLVTAVSEYPVLSAIKPGAVTISADTRRDHKLYAALAPIDLNASRSSRGRHVGEKTPNSCIVVLKLPSTKRKHSHTSATGDDSSLGGKSITGKCHAQLLSKPQHGSSGRLGKQRPGLPMRHVVILRIGKKTRTNAPRLASEVRLIKPKYDPTIKSDNASSSRVRSSGVRATAALPSKSKHSSNASSRSGLGDICRRTAATHRSSGQDGSNPETATSKNRKRKGEDGPSGEGNELETPVKRRMAMKEESWKGSQSQ